MTKLQVATGGVAAREIPIHVPFTISRESLPSAALALVTLTDEAGRTGLGECAPFPSLTGDDVPTAVRVAGELVQGLTGRTPDAGLVWLKAQRPEVFSVSPTAYAGVEGALWDLHARQLGKSLAALWGDAGVTSLTTDITLPIMEPAAVPAFWRLFQGHRFPIVKIKVSGNVDADLDLVHALLRAAPMGTGLTLDGNQGFTPAGARKLVESLLAGGVRPLFFEQPLPEDDYEGLAALQATTPVPVCLDETVRTVRDAERAVTEKLGGLINIKIMKSGIDEARGIIQTARRGGLPLMIGGMLESEVAMGTSLQLAAGTGAITFADLDTPFFFTERVTKDSPWHRDSARLVPPKGPGHGLELKV